jgi:uncharacterized protein
MVSSPQHEPTMEEILASIRKIISEDTPETPPAPAAEAKAVPAAATADVLELTQVVDETPPPAPAPEPVQPAPMPENDVVFEPIEEPAVPQEATASVQEGIFSEKNRKALEETLTNIAPKAAAAPRVESAPVSAPIDAGTVEAVFERAVREAFEPVVKNWLGDNSNMVVERMKPLIQEWMNEHFPVLLRDTVRDELARAERMKPFVHERLDQRFPEILGAVRDEVERLSKAGGAKL